MNRCKTILKSIKKYRKEFHVQSSNSFHSFIDPSLSGNFTPFNYFQWENPISLSYPKLCHLGNYCHIGKTQAKKDIHLPMNIGMTQQASSKPFLSVDSFIDFQTKYEEKNLVMCYCFISEILCITQRWQYCIIFNRTN